MSAKGGGGGSWDDRCQKTVTDGSPWREVGWLIFYPISKLTEKLGKCKVPPSLSNFVTIAGLYWARRSNPTQRFSPYLKGTKAPRMEWRTSGSQPEFLWTPNPAPTYRRGWTKHGAPSPARPSLSFISPPEAGSPPGGSGKATTVPSHGSRQPLVLLGRPRQEFEEVRQSLPKCAFLCAWTGSIRSAELTHCAAFWRFSPVRFIGQTGRRAVHRATKLGREELSHFADFLQSDPIEKGPRYSKQPGRGVFDDPRSHNGYFCVGGGAPKKIPTSDYPATVFLSGKIFLHRSRFDTRPANS